MEQPANGGAYCVTGGNLMSPQIDKLAAALAKAQGEMRPAKKNRENPYFKSSYADLEATIEATREPFSNNGLSFVHVPIIGPDGRVVLRGMLLHSSGQYLTGQYPITPVKNDPQGLGSAISYARRYSLQAMAGIATEDDDGNEASGKSGAADSQGDGSDSTVKLVSEAQVNRLWAIAKKQGWSHDDVMGALASAKPKPVTDLMKMDWLVYREFIKYLEENPQKQRGVP